jgi:hypothetical protein
VVKARRLAAPRMPFIQRATTSLDAYCLVASALIVSPDSEVLLRMK